MDWNSVDGKDFAATSGNYVFRLRFIEVVTKILDNNARLKENAYQLEIRKKGKVNFVELGYKFFVPSYISHIQKYGVELSVDEKYWTLAEDIHKRSTEILSALNYLNENDIENVG